MKTNKLFKNFIALCTFLAFITTTIAQTTVSGTVMDAGIDAPLPGASVVEKGTTNGVTSDFDGNFTFKTSSDSGEIEISYLGYSSVTISFNGDSDLGSISLSSDVAVLDDVVVSASRRLEKVQDAPAAVSIITADEIENKMSVSPLRLLDNTVGVSIDRQGSTRTNVTLRGKAGMLTTKAFVMLDYRSLISAGIDMFDANMTAINSIDLERIEVVRGPGSALYGPNVTDGVVHFLSKDPFKYPGTTIEHSLGDMSTAITNVRYAEHNNDKTFGYKVVARYITNGELDYTEGGGDGATLAQFAQFHDANNNGMQDDGEMSIDGLADGGMTYSISSSVYLRPESGIDFVGSAGYNYTEGIALSDRGELWNIANDYFVQGRLTYDNLFAQVYYNANLSPTDINKNGFLYRTGGTSIVDRNQLEAQLQYNLDIGDMVNVTMGADYRSSRFNSKGTAFGRYDDQSDFDIMGGYIQAKASIGDKIDLVAAARFDQFYWGDFDESREKTADAVSPRFGIVYKPNERHSFRATYNKASSANSALSHFLDLPIQDFGAFDLWLYGNSNAQTFNNVETTSLVPGVGNTPGIGADLNEMYTFITNTIIGMANDGNAQLGALAPLFPLLNSPGFASLIQGTSAGVPIDFDGNFMMPIEAPASTLRTDTTIEVGYKGQISDKTTLAVDVYQMNIENFTAIRQLSPLVVLPTLHTDIQAAVSPVVAGALMAQGMDPATAAFTAGLVGGAYAQVALGITGGGTVPSGVVESDQMINDSKPSVALGYAHYGELTYVGADVALEHQVTDKMSFFANYSYVENSNFSAEDLGSTNPGDSYALNFAQHRFNSGLTWNQDQGMVGSLRFKHNGDFQAVQGTLYTGYVPARTMLDVSMGYKFKDGTYLDLAIDNALNDRYRLFPNMPWQGRRILATVRYSID